MEEVSAFWLRSFNMTEGSLSWGTMCSTALNSGLCCCLSTMFYHLYHLLLFKPCRKTFTSSESHTFLTFFFSLVCLKEEKKTNLGYNCSRIHFEDYGCLCRFSVRKTSGKDDPDRKTFLRRCTATIPVRLCHRRGRRFYRLAALSAFGGEFLTNSDL